MGPAAVGPQQQLQLRLCPPLCRCAPHLLPHRWLRRRLGLRQALPLWPPWLHLLLQGQQRQCLHRQRQQRHRPQQQQQPWGPQHL